MPGKHINSSTPTKKAISKASKISNKIATQIIRFNNMSKRELIAHFQGNSLSSFCSLKINKKELYYGLEGRRYFFELAKTLIEYNPEIKGRTDVNKTIGTIKDAYINTFITENKPIDLQSTKLMLDIASEKTTSKFKKYKHYIPCVFFLNDGPDELQLGPVTLVRTPVFLSSITPPIWLDESDGTIPVSQHAIERYKEYPWIACVEIGLCDFDVSFEVATYACVTALNAIRVCFGAEATKMVRTSTEASVDLKFAKIWATPDGTFECLYGNTFKSPSGPTDWHQHINEGDGGDIKNFLASVIYNACELNEHSELSSRLIDAVNWFGDACLEKSPAASIVKYVTAIERLYLSKSDTGVKARFVLRVSKILSDFELCKKQLASQHASRIYDLRSTLVHGGSSPRAGETEFPQEEAEMIAQGCILCAAQLYMIIHDAFAPKTPEEVELAMEAYVVNGLEWCIQKAKKTSLNVR
jgi:hypothetical protein